MRRFFELVRRLLCKAVVDWKKECVARLYSEGRMTLERTATDGSVSVRDDGIFEAEEDASAVRSRRPRRRHKEFLQKDSGVKEGYLVIVCVRTHARLLP